MIGRLSALCMTIAVATAPAVAALQAGGSPQPCRLPFETIATRPDPAAACRFEGCFTNQDKKFEDLAKNSLCLDPSHPTGAVVADTGKVQREKCAKAKPVNKPCPGKVP